MPSELIAARDSDGKLRWFNQECSTSWGPRHGEDGPLFVKDGIWILMPGLFESFKTTEGKIVEAEVALAWFIRNDYEPPEQIAEFAAERRL